MEEEFTDTDDSDRGSDCGSISPENSLASSDTAFGAEKAAAVDFGNIGVVKCVAGICVDAELLEPGAKLQRSAEKELRAHGLEIVLFEGALDACKEGGEFYEFVFERGKVLFLEPFDMESI